MRPKLTLALPAQLAAHWTVDMTEAKLINVLFEKVCVCQWFSSTYCLTSVLKAIGFFMELCTKSRYVYRPSVYIAEMRSGSCTSQSRVCDCTPIELSQCHVLDLV